MLIKSTECIFVISVMHLLRMMEDMLGIDISQLFEFRI